MAILIACLLIQSEIEMERLAEAGIDLAFDYPVQEKLFEEVPFLKEFHEHPEKWMRFAKTLIAPVEKPK